MLGETAFDPALDELIERLAAMPAEQRFGVLPKVLPLSHRNPQVARICELLVEAPPRDPRQKHAYFVYSMMLLKANELDASSSERDWYEASVQARMLRAIGEADQAAAMFAHARANGAPLQYWSSFLDG